jgi:5'-nucleotidase
MKEVAMRILIANDDGIDAPGLALLEQAALQLSDDVWVVAPAAKRTAAGHSLTIARPLTMERLGPQRFSCSGTPADCVMAAMTWLFKDGPRPDLVLSGVNDGRNVAQDIAYSGTLGIAREATFWGLPAIAFSRVKNAETSARDAPYLGRLVSQLWAGRGQWLVKDEWLSINLPSRLPAPISAARIGSDKVGTSCDILSEVGPRTEIIIPRGREDTSFAGDENAALQTGFATINRLKWNAQTPLDADFLSALATDA